MYPDGGLTIQRLGEKEHQHEYSFQAIGFAGDCVYATQRHFMDCLISGDPFEPNGEDYLKSLSVQEAVYASANTGKPVQL